MSLGIGDWKVKLEVFETFASFLLLFVRSTPYFNDGRAEDEKNGKPVLSFNFYLFSQNSCLGFRGELL